MLGEVRDLDQRHAVDAVADQESGRGQVVEHSPRVGVPIERQRLGGDALGAILKPTLAVGQHPQVHEQQTGQRRQLGELVVVHDGWLDVAGSCHQVPCPSE